MPPLLHDTLIDSSHLDTTPTVPMSLVHKRTPGNVFVTDIAACAEDRFQCSGRLPLAHPFFNDAGRTPARDILFFTELGRQASLAISHEYLGVAMDDVFIFESSTAELPETLFAADVPCDAPVLIDIRVSDISRRRNTVNRVVAEHVMWVGDRQVFRGTGAWTLQPAALFQRLRRAAAKQHTPFGRPATPTARPERARLAHAHGANVVVSAPRRASATGEYIASLIVDDSHAFFFDHPCDHVPGMLLLEGCAQLAQAAVAASRGVDATSAICSYDVDFAQFVECGPTTTLIALVHPDATGAAGQQRKVTVSIEQQGQVCGVTTIGLVLPCLA